MQTTISDWSLHRKLQEDEQRTVMSVNRRFLLVICELFILDIVISSRNFACNVYNISIKKYRKKFWDLNESVLLSSTVSSRDQEISSITNTSQALFNFDVEETGNVCSKLQRSNNYGYLLNDNYQNDNFTAEYDNCYDEDNTSPKCHYQQRHWVKSTTYNRVQFDGSKSSFVMIEKDDIPKLIKEVLSDLSYKLRPAFNDSCHLIVGNNTDESANTRSINTQNDDFLLFQNQLAGNLSFSIDSFGVTCLDDLVFSVEKFQEFAITSEFIGLNELNILLNMYSTNKSANTQYYCPTCLDKIQLLSRKVVEQSGWSSLSIFSLDFEMTNLLRCCSGFTIRMITIDSFIERLIESQYYHQHHSCRFKHQPSLQNSDNDKQFIPGSLCSHDILEKDAFPVSFAKIAQLADDHGAGWPYATAMMSYFISLKTASVTHNPFTLESALIISNKGNKLRALALNIYELLDEKDIVSVCNLKNQNVDNFTQRKRHDSTSCFGISLLKQVPVSCLKRMYERHFRIVLDPYLHGYSNLQEMLKSMSPSWLDIITDRNSQSGLCELNKVGFVSFSKQSVY
ncbi:hypothetical protein GJ496_001511 [Pomphorhynchus laevis]|nr:hypothetical protein GJ496_001511 [Pomphorhynchus laevis]